jgi:hypothetical protein
MSAEEPAIWSQACNELEGLCALHLGRDEAIDLPLILRLDDLLSFETGNPMKATSNLAWVTVTLLAFAVIAYVAAPSVRSGAALTSASGTTSK